MLRLNPHHTALTLALFIVLISALSKATPLAPLIKKLENTESLSKPVKFEYRPYNLTVNAQVFSPIKAKAEGTIQFSPCKTQLWCYDINTEVTIAELQQRIVLQMGQHRLFPLLSTQKERLFFSKSSFDIRFDYKNKVINTRSDKNKSRQQTLLNRHFDSVSFPLDIQKRLFNGETMFNYPIIEGHKTKQNHYKVVGKDVVTSPLGKIEAILVKQINNNDELSIWFAPQWDFLPVQFETRKKGKLLSRVTVSKGTYNQQPLTIH